MSTPDERRRETRQDDAQYADYGDNYENRHSGSVDIDDAGRSAYEQSRGNDRSDDELNSALGVDAANDEDEENMPEPRRRAREYRAGSAALPRYDEADEADEAAQDYADDEPAPEPPRQRRPAAKPAARKPARPQKKRPAQRPEPQDEPDYSDEEPDAAAEDFAEYADAPTRSGKRTRSRFARETGHSREEDNLEDYTGDESAAYSDDVYDPYDYEDDTDSDEELHDNSSEWTDGIKRALSKGRAGLLALGAKARSGGDGKKKHPAAKKKRPSAQKPPRREPRPVEPETADALDDYIDDNAQPAGFEQQAQPDIIEQQERAGEVREVFDNPEKPRRVVDVDEYSRVSEALNAADEQLEPAVSRRQRRQSQEQVQRYVSDADMPKVNIVSRRAMRAQQAADQPAPVVENAAPQQEMPAAQPAAEAPAPEMPPVNDGFAPQPAQPDMTMPQQPVNAMPGQDAMYGAADQSAYGAQPVAFDDDADMKFGIQGRTHIMQPEYFQTPAQNPVQPAPVEPQPFGQPVQPDFGGYQPEVQPEPVQHPVPEPQPAQAGEPQPEAGEEAPHKLSRKGKKSGRKARKAPENIRQRDFDLSDDDDDEDDGPSMQAPRAKRSPVNVSTEAPRAPRQTSYYADDDEPEDGDNAQPQSASFDVSGYGDYRKHPDDADFSGDPYREDMYEEDEDDNYSEPAAEERGGCLKAFTIFLVIMLLLFGSVWALDYFNVISVRKVFNDVTSMSIFNPLRGNILPATAAPGNTEATTVPGDAQAVATMQPADNTTAPDGAQDSATADPAATVDPASTAEVTQQASADSPEMISQANLLSNEAAEPAVTAEPQPFYLSASPVESVLPDSTKIGLEYGVYVDYDRDREYSRPDPISFGLGSDYTELEGVITFRGNNFRENAAYGTADLSKKKLEVIWSNKIGSIDSGYTVWTGVGWNGQPVMIHWSDEMRQMMNIRDEFKSNSDLVEVIYGALDGNIYFLDAETGNYTRDPIELGYPIKGSVSIDPRGYPLLYVGQGISKANGHTGSIGWRVYNLLNQEHMYLLNGHDDLRFRTHGSFDGVCLLDAETDTIVEGAENGIFYTIDLNTNFDPTAPSITIDPKVTLYRYKSKISDELGIENSVAAYGQYAYFVDNSGLMTCMDLNSMTPVWLYDVGDDTDSSISIEQQSDGVVAMYTANEVDKQGSEGQCTIRKLNALTGEVMWDFSVKCKSDGTNGGGAFASPAMGKNSLSELIYFNICRTSGGGTLYAFNKQTGEIVWQKSTERYSWSSPVLVYTESGEGVLVMGNSGGMLRMYDGLTGELYDELEIKGNMEGSPAVYNDTLVIGTRGERIYGIRIL